MRKLEKEHAQKAGLPPGTLVYFGERRVDRSTITVVDYDGEGVREHTVETAEACREYLKRPTVTWINVTGLHDTELLQQTGDVFGLHPLILEDIATLGQRPKVEDHSDYIYVVLTMLYRSRTSGDILAEQVSLVVGRNYLLSFQEVEGDVFEMIRERLRAGKGRIRKLGVDYLAYALLDAIVDNYFVVLEEVGDRIEQLQAAILEEGGPETLQKIHRLKSEMIFMRKNVWPVRELVSGLEKSDSALIQKSTRPYLRDLYEHTIHVIDSVETLRDMLSTALDIYVSSVSNRMNEVMKVLTVIATIFIPLTFIVGVYGMNFDVMPELRWKYGYVGIWAFMLTVGVGMFVYFKRRKWM